MLDEHGVNSLRVRSLPAVAITYYCMALSLYPEAAYEDVFAVVAQGLAWMQGNQAVPTVAKSSISAARSKIGCAPLQVLHQRACVPLAVAAAQPEAFYAGLRLVAIDGSNFEVPDEPVNAAAFGYPGSRTGHAAYPQAQCAVLVECATHAILGANLGVLAHAPSCQRGSGAATNFILHRTCASVAPRSAPIRGLSPQCAPDCGEVGSQTCCAKPPRCEAPVAAGAPIRVWSNDETRLMSATIQLNCRALDPTARQRCYGHSLCQRGQPLQFYAKRTVLRSDTVLCSTRAC